MSLFSEDDTPRKPSVHEMGQDISALSVAELEHRILLLQQEIMRLEEARLKKVASRTAAESFFKLCN
jgi:uncharacterized small protein (DUF1192 family)